MSYKVLSKLSFVLFAFNLFFVPFFVYGGDIEMSQENLNAATGKLTPLKKELVGIYAKALGSLEDNPSSSKVHLTGERKTEAKRFKKALSKNEECNNAESLSQVALGLGILRYLGFEEDTEKSIGNENENENENDLKQVYIVLEGYQKHRQVPEEHVSFCSKSSQLCWCLGGLISLGCTFTGIFCSVISTVVICASQDSVCPINETMINAVNGSYCIDANGTFTEDTSLINTFTDADCKTVAASTFGGAAVLTACTMVITGMWNCGKFVRETIIAFKNNRNHMKTLLDDEAEMDKLIMRTDMKFLRKIIEAKLNDNEKGA
jgi:hypothetical protein